MESIFSRKGCVLLFSSVKNFLISFAITLCAFGVVAFLAIAIIINSIGGAFFVDPFGDGNPGNDTEEGPGEYVPGLDTHIEGNSLYILVTVTDYRPSFYGDYDYEYIKHNIGVVGSGGIPDDVRPSVDAVLDLQTPPENGSIDYTWNGTPNIIGGIRENNERIIHNDVTVLVRMDKERRQFTFTYFPSNAVVDYGGERLLFREIYYYHGIDGLINTVHSITGIRPDRHMLLHSEYVDDVIDEINGFDFAISNDISVLNYEDGISLDLPAGQVTLDGDTVQALLLHRNYSTTDAMTLERMGVNVIRAFISRLTQPAGYATAGQYYNRIKSFFVTDLTVDDIVGNRDVWYAYSAFGKVHIDILGREVTENGTRVFKIDDARTLDLFSSYRKVYE